MASFPLQRSTRTDGGNSAGVGGGAAGGDRGGQPQSLLAKLAADARRLNNQLPGRSELPSINYGLQQIDAQSRRMQSGLAQDDPNAAYFLAPALNVAKLSEDVRNVDVRHTFEPLLPIFDTDIEHMQGYLKHRHEQILMSTIEETRKKTVEDTLDSLDRSFHRDWERQKRKIFEELGQYQQMSGEEPDIALASSRSVPLPTAASEVGIGGPNPSANLAMHSRMMQYDVVVQSINQARLERTPISVARAFLDVVHKLGVDARTMPLYEAWQAVAALTGDFSAIGAQDSSSQQPVKERQYASAYMDAERHYTTTEGEALRVAFVRGAKRYLEAQYQGYVDATISAQPVKAQLGGEPTTEARILAFLRVAHQDRDNNWSPELELVQTSSGPVPAWATIYMLLRIGEPQRALAFANEHEALPGWTDPAFSAYLSAYLKSGEGGLETRLPKTLRDKVLAEYNSRIRNVGHIDPFKQALYKILGRIDVHKKFPALLTRQTENWLWLQLSMVRESDEDGSASGVGFGTRSSGLGANVTMTGARDRYTLYDLGQKILASGETHFDPKGQRALFYFQVLVLTAQFERAVAYLYSRPQHQVDAVQFAAALTYYGLLRVTPETSAPMVDIATVILTETGHQVAYLDFAKLVQRYIRLFQRSDTREALQYLFLITLNADGPGQTGEEQVRRCHNLTRTVVMDSKQIPDLLGEVRPDGTKVPGFLQRYLPLLKLTDQNAFLNNIVHQAAAAAEESSQIRAAILLYNLAEDYDKVLAVLNKELGATLLEPIESGGAATAPPAPGAVTQTTAGQVLADGSAALTAMARDILSQYEGTAHIVKKLSVRNRQTCTTLLGLKEFIDLYVARDLENALERMEALNLIPLQVSEQNQKAITRKAEEFKSVDESISRNLSELLIITMRIIKELHERLKESPYGDAARQQRMLDLRSKARNLMTWAGMLRLRMNQDMYAQLMRLDVFIH